MILEAIDISRYYTIGERSVQALAPVSLTVGEGEFLVVTGPSGSGKSTMLNLLSGFDRPSSGNICFHGKNIGLLSDREKAALRNRSFGFIYQSPHLLADKSVLENVMLPFHYGEWIDMRQVREKCEKLLEYVGLLDLADRYPTTLSGGEMQRAVFARALSREPEIIFADEPTGSLDAANSKKLLEMLQQQTLSGRTVIMVTHEAEAVRYGSKFLSLSKCATSPAEER